MTKKQHPSLHNLVDRWIECAEVGVACYTTANKDSIIIVVLSRVLTPSPGREYSTAHTILNQQA